MSARTYHFLEAPVERLTDAHGGSIRRVAWNQKIGLADWVVVLEIEIWIRTGCLQAAAKNWGVEEIRTYHLLDQWDLALVEIKYAQMRHLPPKMAPFLGQAQDLFAASAILPFRSPRRRVIDYPH